MEQYVILIANKGIIGLDNVLNRRKSMNQYITDIPTMIYEISVENFFGRKIDQSLKIDRKNTFNESSDFYLEKHINELDWSKFKNNLIKDIYLRIHPSVKCKPSPINPEIKITKSENYQISIANKFMRRGEEYIKSHCKQKSILNLKSKFAIMEISNRITKKYEKNQNL